MLVLSRTDAILLAQQLSQCIDELHAALFHSLRACVRACVCACIRVCVCVCARCDYKLASVLELGVND